MRDPLLDQFPRRLTADEQHRKIVADFFAPARASHISPDIVDRYERCATTGSDAEDERRSFERGLLGLYLFCHYVERWESFGEDTDRDHADQLLKDPQVQQTLYELYDIDPAYRYATMAVLAAGTTSFIIKSNMLHGRFRSVVKIIKPWYLTDTAISEQTKNAKRFYDHELSRVTYQKDKPVSPYVESSNRQSIIMELVNGSTLRSYFSELWSGGKTPAESYSSLNRVMDSLCDMLAECNRQSVAHGDLSTTNILVEDPEAERPRLRLIDFGINYLLTRNLGRITDNLPLTLTIDPVVMENKIDARPTLESDVYALGIILIEGFLGRKYRVDTPQVMLDRVYQRHPGLGAILDDLLDPVPSRRLANIPADMPPYTYIAGQLDTELHLVSLFSAVDKRFASRSWLRVLDDLAGMIFPGIKDIAKYALSRLGRGHARRSGTGDRDRSSQVAPPEFSWTELPLLPLALNVATVSIVVQRLAPVDSILQGEAISGSIGQNWPAWIVAASCSIVASNYFISIYSGLSMNELPRRCGIAAQLCAVVPWIPIAVVLFRFPEQWPICAALGATLIVANNCLWYWFTKAASTAIETMGIHTSPLMRETRFWLRGWRETSLITLFCLYAVAVLLAFGILQDAALYALLLAVVVNGRVYFANLRSDAPHIRTGIQRFTHGYRRAEAVRGSDVRIRAGALDTRPTAYDP